jgi:hypothetical protein
MSCTGWCDCCEQRQRPGVVFEENGTTGGCFISGVWTQVGNCEICGSPIWEFEPDKVTVQKIEVTDYYDYRSSLTCTPLVV